MTCRPTAYNYFQKWQRKFEQLPHRWIVERSFGWLNRYRRMSKDYELHTEFSDGMIYGAFIRLMLRRFDNSAS